jgi:uncharacterized caspase-like protein
MFARLSVMAALVAPVLIAAEPACADKRVALVVGISAYEHAPRLANSVNDAASMTALFKNAGFDVVETRRDIGIVEFRRAVREFSDKVRDSDIAVLYYAGHGIEVDGTNFLIPADAKLQSDFDIEDEALSLDRVLKSLDPAKRLRLVILDACRENPFAKSMRRTTGTRAVNRGLARVEPTSSDTLVAFAARAGAVAADGEGRNSPYTTALVKYLASPGLDLRIALGRVRDEVLKSTNNRQEPFVYGSLGGATVALVSPPEVVVAAPADPAADARRDYELAAQVGTVAAWESFLAVHSTGFYANLARSQLAKLADTQRKSDEQAKQKADELAGKQKADELAKQQAAERAQQQAAELAKQQAAEAAKQKAADVARQQAELEKQKAAELAKQQAADLAKQQAAELAKQQAAEAQRKAEDLARQNAEEQAKPAAPMVVAAAPADASVVAAPKAAPLAMDPADIARLLQAHLKRVGCDPSANDGVWGESSRKALEQFNKNAGTRLDVKVASLDALDAVRGKNARVCPLVCPKGQRAAGDSCIEIGCKAGYERDRDGDCVRKEAPKTASRPPAAQPTRSAPPAAASPPAAATASSGGGQVVCGKTGCREIPKHCRPVVVGLSGHQKMVCD